MNKLLKIITYPFYLIYKILDKIIITPISKIIFLLIKKFHLRSGIIDKLLNKPGLLIYISLFLAIITFLVIDNRAVSLVEREAEVITGQELEVKYNEEEFVIEGLPNTVDITLIGRKSDLYLAKQLGDHKVTLDLTGYKVGNYKVKLKYNHAVETVNYKLDPSTINIAIKKKMSVVKTLIYDVLNQDKLNSTLSVGTITLSKNEIVVQGSSETLEKVATVKALVDVSTADITAAGTYKIDKIPLVAYDVDGEIIKNIEVVPQTITADVVIESFSTEVPIKIVTTGTATVGYAISSMVPSVSKVTIYGDQSILTNITAIEAKIDITDLNSDKSFNITLSKPTGVRHISETNVKIQVYVETEATIEINDISVDAINLDSKYTAQAATETDRSITVIAKGVKSLLNNIDNTTIKAEVDLTGYSVGTHDIPVTIKSEDARINYQPKNKTVKIIITNKR